MFTGIIETTGKLLTKKKKGDFLRLSFSVNKIQKGMKLGDSVATNGVCLTVTDFNKTLISMDVVNTTLKATTLGSLTKGSEVNFERAAKLSDRMGGHYVQGHVDGVGVIEKKKKSGKNTEFFIKLPKALFIQLIPKASITINGISLTVQKIEKNGFWTSLIPHTLKVTNMRAAKKNDKLNIEIDILAKYVKKFLKK